MDKTEILRQMIAEKQRQIELYQAMIAEWQREIGEPITGPAATMLNGDLEKKISGSDPIAGVKKYQFFGRSQPEAAKMLLEFVGHPLLTQEIVDGIEKGGVAVGGKVPKDKKINLYTILQRSGDFVRFKRDTWGLRNWPGAPKKMEQEEEKDENEKASA